MTLNAAAVAALKAAAAEIVDLNLGGYRARRRRLGRDRRASGRNAPAPRAQPAHRRGLAALAALPQLTHLNLYGNSGITDTGLALLAASGSLRELFVWQTGVSAEGVAQLRAQRPELIVDFGAESTAAAR